MNRMESIGVIFSMAFAFGVFLLDLFMGTFPYGYIFFGILFIGANDFLMISISGGIIATAIMIRSELSKK